MRKIFVLHDEEAMLKAYEEFLSALGYEVFATSNHYKFLLYAGEISADFLIFDAGEKIDINFIKMLKNQKKTINTPLLVIVAKNNLASYPPEITHLLFKPYDISDFIKILELYEKNKEDFIKHNVFYVENRQKNQDLPDILG